VAAEHIRYCVTRSPLSQPLLDGAISPAGFELQAEQAESMDKVSRAMLELRYDVAEMSIATFVKAQEQGLPLRALPVFTSGRRFLQPGFMLSARSGIHDLSELPGKRVGLPQYWMSSSVWQRMILKQMHGVSPEQVHWVTFATERMEALRVPEGVELVQEKSGRGPLDLLAAGELDVSLSPTGVRDPGGNGQDPVVVPAYPDLEGAIRSYYGSTGIFPIMHMTVIQEELVQREPDIVVSLCDAYERAKASAEPAGPPAAGIDPEKVIGHDPWQFGITPNRRPLDTFLAAALEQGLVSRQFELEELFVANVPAAFR
jgi:4,5-dihydroxyphthalate decarboxylase